MIIYHNHVFGYGNVIVMIINNILLLLINFFIAYILSGINCLQIEVFIRIVFILSLITNILCIIRLMELFLVARYKESLIYVQIRKIVYTKLNKSLELTKKGFDVGTIEECNKKFNNLKWEKEKIKTYENLSSLDISIADKIRRNIKLDCELVKKNKEYDSYFGDAILTLFALYFANPSKYENLLECIAIRIVRKNASGFSEKWGIDDKKILIEKLQKCCLEEVTVKEDIMVLSCIKHNKGDYYTTLKNILKNILKNFQSKE